MILEISSALMSIFSLLRWSGFGIWDLGSLLSKLAVHERGVERAAYDGDGVAKLHHITAEVNPYAQILQHVQPTTPALSACRLPEGGGRHSRRAARAGVHVLGPVRRDVVLSAWARPLVAGDLRRTGELRRQAGAPRRHRAAALDARICECASPLAVVSGGVLPVAGAVSDGGRRQAVPLQAQAAESRYHGD